MVFPMVLAPLIHLDGHLPGHQAHGSGGSGSTWAVGRPGPGPNPWLRTDKASGKLTSFYWNMLIYRGNMMIYREIFNTISKKGDLCWIYPLENGDFHWTWSFRVSFTHGKRWIRRIYVEVYQRVPRFEVRLLRPMIVSENQHFWGCASDRVKRWFPVLLAAFNP